MMQTYRCLRKLKDNNNNTIEFMLQNIQTREVCRVSKDELKTKMTTNQVKITNLQIDSQGRLVDKQERTVNTPVVPRQISDMTNRELKEYITQLQETGNINNKRVLMVLKEIINRNVELDDKINSLITQLAEMNDSTDTEPVDTTTNLNTIQNYFIENQDHLGEIKTDIQGIANQLSNLSLPTQSSALLATSEQLLPEQSIPRNIIQDNGKLEVPSDEYSRYCYNRCFIPELTYRADEDLMEQLANYDSKFSTTNITHEIIEKLKQQIKLTADAYYRTEEFYNAQYRDYASNIRGSTILSYTVGALSNKVTGMSPDTLKSVGKEVISGVGIGFMQLVRGHTKRNPTMDFKNKETLSKDQSRKLMTEIDGIWNSAVEFIENNPEWEVMLYLIQTMNYFYLNTYKIASGLKLNTVTNNKGKMQATDELEFKTGKLTEHSLSSYFKWYNEKSNIQDRQFEYIKMVYDRFIISYFASKKLLYENRHYPFSDTTTKEINGVVVVLTEIGLYLSNVSSETAKHHIGTFTYNNNKSRKYKYAIEIPADITRYIN